MDEKTQLLRAAYAAFNRQDADAVLACMHRDVDWPNAAVGGRVRGHEAVRAYWRGQWERMDPQVEPLRIEAEQDGRTVVQVHQVVRDLEGNLLLDRTVEHVYVIRSGLIVSMEIREPGTD